MNTISVKINGEEYENCSFPIKYDERLDEELDSCTLSLHKSSKKVFKPCTPCEITINDGTNTLVKRFVVAEDRFAQSPMGSGLYRHDLTLIEPTKLLENYQVETLTSTNANPKTYTANAKEPTVDYTEQSEYGKLKFKGFTTPTDKQTYDFKIRELLNFPIHNYAPVLAYDGELLDETRIYHNGVDTGFRVQFGWRDENVSIPLSYGVNIIRVYIEYRTLSTSPIRRTADMTFYIDRVDNHYTRKPKTNIYIINRVLDLVEPLMVNNTTTGELVHARRFNFPTANYTEEQMQKLNSIAPEYSFTRQNLREILRTIGNFIHAEPYLAFNSTTNDFTDIGYKFYGENEFATYTANNGVVKKLNEYNIEAETGSISIEQSLTSVDSYVDNLVNRINWQENTTAQPYENGMQTLRSENSYLRLEQDNNASFPSSRPIQQIKSFVFIDTNGKEWELKDYIYEETLYNTYLDDYSTAYPSSKKYGLYYTQGGKNIKGFFYKNRTIAGGVFGSNYAIVNILDVIGATARPSEYMEYKFRLDYTPIYSERIQHSKSYLGEWLSYPRAVNNSQSANMVETQYYGENIKGLVERLGNVDRVITYTCFKASSIGISGKLWDKDYYIASVSVEVLENKFKVSLGLSKNFNRISEYIGVSSYKRIYEVSETMVQERHSIYKDYYVITDHKSGTYTAEATFLGKAFYFPLMYTFLRDTEQGETYNAKSVVVRGKTKGNSALNTVALPVISSAFGNVIEFSWEFQDNFSAGQKVVHQTSGDITGYFSKEVQYTDYYGEMYYEQWGIKYENITETNIALNLPQISTTSATALRLNTIATTDFNYTAILKRKDNRERIIDTYTVEFVSDKENIIIGSALARENVAVSGYKRKADGTIPKVYLVFLDEYINKFSTKIDLTKWANYNKIEVSNTASTRVSVIRDTDKVWLSGYEAQNIGNYNKAWAYVIEPYEEKSYIVENEDGEQETITDIGGGDILVGENVYTNIQNGTTYGTIDFIPVHDIFNYIKNN